MFFEWTGWDHERKDSLLLSKDWGSQYFYLHQADRWDKTPLLRVDFPELKQMIGMPEHVKYVGRPYWRRRPSSIRERRRVHHFLLGDVRCWSRRRRAIRSVNWRQRAWSWRIDSSPIRQSGWGWGLVSCRAEKPTIRSGCQLANCCSLSSTIRTTLRDTIVTHRLCSGRPAQHFAVVMAKSSISQAKSSALCSGRLARLRNHIQPNSKSI